MVSVLGAWSPNSTASTRGRLEVVYLVPTPAAGASTVDVTVIVYAIAGPTGWSDNTNTLSWSGSLLGAGSVQNVNISLAANQRLQIRSWIEKVTLTSKAQGVTFGAALGGINVLGSSPTASVVIPIPAQGGPSVLKPSNANATYNPSNDTVKLEWGGGVVHRIEAAWKPLVGGDWNPYTSVGDSTFTSGTSAAVTPGRLYRFRVLRRSQGFNSDWAYTPAFETVVKPNNLGSLSVVQNSDNSHALKWEFFASDEEHSPTSFVIEGWRASRGRWERVANPWAETRAWTDTRQLANDYVAWRVAAKNSVGQSAWSTTPYLWTTPAAASNVIATRTSLNTLVVSWDVETPTATGVTQDLQFQSSGDDQAWTAWDDVPGKTGMAGSVESTTFENADPLLNYRFQVITRVKTPTERSVVSRSSSFLTPPQAPASPTPVSPLSHSAVSSLEPVVFRWSFNTIDGSNQTGFRLNYRNVSNPAQPGAWTTVTGTTADRVSIPLDIGEWEWRVQVRGSHATYSDWSTPVVFRVFSPPVVNITSPTGSVVTTNRPVVTYTYTDSLGSQKTQIRRLLNDSGVILEEIHTETRSTTVRFNTLLSNHETYTIQIQAVSNTGLTSLADSYSFSTNFLVPGAPVLEAVWSSETGSVSLKGTNLTGATATAHNRIERRANGGAWEVVYDNLSLNPDVVDEYTQLNSTVDYQLVSVSSTGTETRSNMFTVFTETLHSWLHYGPGLSKKMRLTCEIENDLSFKTDVVLHKLLGRAKRVPVHALDWAPEVKISVSASVIDVFVGDPERELMKASLGNVYWRDYQQRRMWGVIPDGGGKPEWKYSFINFTLEEIEGALPRG